MKTRLFLIILVLTGTFSFAQTKVADKFFESYAYIKASELYEDAVKNGDDSVHVLTRLGDCYYNNSNSEKAAIWYKKALDKDVEEVSSDHLYKYIQTQRSLGNYQEAEAWLDTFKLYQSGDSRIASEITDLSVYDELSSMSKVYINVVNLDLNTKYSDFGGYEYNGRMFFASARNSEVTGKKIYNWNEQPYLDIFETTVNETNGVKEFGSIVSIDAQGINTPYHEATVAITNDGKTIYFTRDNLSKRNKLNSDNKGTTHLKIYKATLDNGNWKNIEELEFNNDKFSTGHPALNPDNTKLYFVSDREHEDAQGQTDIYVVDILEDGNNYSKPRNLGPAINTPGREMFPFIAKDSTMYFSSDGFINLGLLDIYKTAFLKDFYAPVENLRAPFNSGYDDFAFYMDSDTKTGYFSSHRPGGKGNDDIYSFSTYKCKQIVKGIVRDKETKEPISGATVELINQSGKIINHVTTIGNGKYHFEVDCKKNYSVRASKPVYEDDLQSLTTTAFNNQMITADLYLKNLLAIPCEIVINPIFFDFNKSNIRTDSKYELENIVDALRAYPDMKIIIESHTDRRGNLKYNDRLSDRRAKSTRDYIISRGIAAKRIVSATGYGERKKLIGDNEIDNMPTRAEKEAAHQKNRRSYFKIVDCKKDEK
ncbi:OmpA family protein [Jejuia spongiicola]|uniref:OmpA family protein n=1 Tax=Jejuia spongiicola TaxID=2942207 RepID=A0ABT0QID8_9FLAO|nr:OmpA family protein [Jejuia spongiicola]MCL6296358.1 OmpA family protein [Jejuia spongiicola]